MRVSDVRIRPSVRPSMSPATIGMLAVLAGVLIGEAVTWHLSMVAPGRVRICTIVCMVLLGACGLVVFVLRRHDAPRRREAPVLVGTMLLVGMVSSSLCWGYWEAGMRGLESSAPGEYNLEISSDPVEGKFGYSSEGRVILEGTSAGRADAGLSVPVRIYWQNEEDVAGSGEIVRAQCRFKVSDDEGALRHYHRGGTSGTVAASSDEEVGYSQDLVGFVAPLRASLVTQLAVVGGDGQALVRGVALGDRTGIRGTPMEDDFRICGLSHLLAVSGSHLAVVAAIVAWAVSRLSMKRVLRHVLLLSFILFYVVLSGLQISAIRAALMACVGLSSFLFGRRANALSSCSVCCIVLMVVDPTVVFSLSFQLSACAVFGIVIFMPYLTEWFLRLTDGRGEKLVEPVAMTLAAQVATLPLTVSTFSTLAIISPVANLVAAPLVSALLTVSLPVLLVCGFFSVGWAINLCAALGSFVAWTVSLLAQVPHASVPAHMGIGEAVLIAVLLVLVWAWWPTPTKKRARCLAAVCAAVPLVFVIFSARASAPSIVVMDIGQGDAVLIQDGKDAILVDTGPEDTALLSALARNRISDLEAVIITHKHDDHCGALDALDGMVDVDKVYFADGMDTLDDTAFKEVLHTAQKLGDGTVGYLSVGDTFKTRHFTIVVLWPHEIADEGANQDSICLLVSYDDEGDGIAESTALLTGDAECEVLDALIAEGALGHVDVVKVGHHGSAVAFDEGSLEVLTPVVAAISVGEGNDYGHPKPETLELLEEFDVPVYRTDFDGDIRIKFDGYEITVN